MLEESIKSVKFKKINISVRTNDPKEKIDGFMAIKKKYTAHKILITEWWEHPIFNRGNSWWLTYIDGIFYDVHYSSHEFETEDHKIEYTLSLKVELASPNHVENQLQDYKNKRHNFYQNQLHQETVNLIKGIEKDYKAKIEKLNEEMKKKIEQTRKSYYDNSWQLVEEEIHRELYGKNIKSK